MEYLSAERSSRDPSSPDGVTVRQQEGCAVVELVGDLDLYTGPALHNALHTLVSTHTAPQVILDISGLEFLDSSGLGVLIAALRRIRSAGGSLRLAGGRGPVADVLTITGLHHVFATYLTVADALVDATTEVGHTPNDAPGAITGERDQPPSSADLTST
jgi:anti-sigma B factor antagonist